MQMERERWNGSIHELYSTDRAAESDSRGFMSSQEIFFANQSPISSPVISPTSSCGRSCIEHPVSKLDTLAGVAIKYGVEVSDIKKMNGLVTDLQMFALKSLQIPLPGRHPPSTTCLSNGSDSPGQSTCDHTLASRVHNDLLETFQSLRLKSSSQQNVSSAMSSLQGYYGLEATGQKSTSEGFEMAVYRKGGAHCLQDGPFLKPLPTSNTPLSHHRKSHSLVDGFYENGELPDTTIPVTEARDADSDKWSEKLFRRRQKSEADFSRCAPEMLLKDDDGNSGGFSAIKGKGLALRPKSASRIARTADADGGGLNSIPLGFRDSFVLDGFSGVKKSSSTSSLSEQDNAGSSSSIRPTSKWSLKPDIQALSTAAITKPIFDGLPKQITGRRKAALD